VIVAGESDLYKLAALRNYRCRKDEAEIVKVLTGTWREDHLFVLRQSMTSFNFYTWQIETCDKPILRTYTSIRPNWDDPNPEDQIPLPSEKPRSHGKNTLTHVQVRSQTLKTHNRVEEQAFRQAAAAVILADCSFGAFYRRPKSRLGSAQAIVATAHKIALVV
jgi:hypothetical protein